MKMEKKQAKKIISDAKRHLLIRLHCYVKPIGFTNLSSPASVGLEFKPNKSPAYYMYMSGCGATYRMPNISFDSFNNMSLYFSVMVGATIDGVVNRKDPALVNAERHVVSDALLTLLNLLLTPTEGKTVARTHTYDPEYENVTKLLSAVMKVRDCEMPQAIHYIMTYIIRRLKKPLHNDMPIVQKLIISDEMEYALMLYYVYDNKTVIDAMFEVYGDVPNRPNKTPFGLPYFYDRVDDIYAKSFNVAPDATIELCTACEREYEENFIIQTDRLSYVKPDELYVNNMARILRRRLANIIKNEKESDLVC